MEDDYADDEFDDDPGSPEVDGAKGPAAGVSAPQPAAAPKNAARKKPKPAAPARAAAAPARQRTRPRLSQKGATPSMTNLTLIRDGGPSSDPLRRELSLPALGGPHAESAMLDQSELLASEQLSVAVSAEMQAQEHLRRVRARVQRELRKASSLSALERVRERKQHIANSSISLFSLSLNRCHDCVSGSSTSPTRVYHYSHYRLIVAMIA